MHAAIFDLDGTLLDTVHDIAGSANEILEGFGLSSHPVPAYQHFAGDGVEKLFERALPEGKKTSEMIRSCVLEFESVYAKHWRRNSKPFPGIPELLHALREKKMPLAVLSNKMDVFTKLIVEELFPEGTFEIVLGAREGVPKKPDPLAAHEIARGFSLHPEKIFFVGDTSTDMKTASAAGMIPLGVLWGFRDEEELTSTGASQILRTPADMLSLIP